MKFFTTILLLFLSVGGFAQLQPINVPGDSPRQIYVKARDNFNYLETRTDSIVAVIPTSGGGGGTAYNGDPTVILQDASHRFVTDPQIITWNGKAEGNHNHDLSYAALVHDHDALYASLSHDHDATYSLLAHNHDLVYSNVTHNHDGDYATLTHNHNGVYSLLGHNHDLDYSAIGHTHANYSLTTHDHTGVYEPEGDYALANHNHNATYSLLGHNHDATYSLLTHNHNATYSLLGHGHTIGEVTGLQTALDNKAPLASPTFTGTPSAPTASPGTNTTQVATTAFVTSAVAAGGGGGSGNRTILIQASDVATGANTTPVNITGMSFDYEANTRYAITIFGVVQSGAGTTGFGYGVNCSTAPALVALTGYVNSSSAGAASAWSSHANNTINATTSGTIANAQTTSSNGGGIVLTGGTAGTMQFIYRSETTAVTTAKANTVIIIEKIN